jgi:hypothetical protein
MYSYNIYTLRTKPEFLNLYQYLSNDNHKKLEQQILTNGYRTPIYTWNGIIVSGVEAYEIFQEHNILFRIKRLHFSCKEAVISWICTEQLQREDLTNANKKYLIGKKYDAEKYILTNQLSSYQHKTKANTQNDKCTTDSSCSTHAAKKIAEEYHIATATVHKYNAYSHAIDSIYSKTPELAQRIRAGLLWISHSNVIELSVLSKEQLLRLNKYLLDEHIEHLSYHDMKRELSWHNYTHPTSSKKATIPTPAIRNLPQFDPDAEIASLTLTIPSWNSSIDRVMNVSNFKIASDDAKNKLKYQLMCLLSSANNILKTLEEN